MNDGTTTTNILFDDMSWPYPGPAVIDVAYTLMYGKPTRSDLAVAASVIAAYKALIQKPIKNRNKMASKLKTAAFVAYAELKK